MLSSKCCGWCRLWILYVFRCTHAIQFATECIRECFAKCNICIIIDHVRDCKQSAMIDGCRPLCSGISESGLFVAITLQCIFPHSVRDNLITQNVHDKRTHTQTVHIQITFTRTHARCANIVCYSIKIALSNSLYFLPPPIPTTLCKDHKETAHCGARAMPQHQERLPESHVRGSGAGGRPLLQGVPRRTVQWVYIPIPIITAHAHASHFV